MKNILFDIFLFLFILSFSSNLYAKEAVQPYHYQENDVISFVYHWFAVIDHQLVGDYSRLTANLSDKDLSMSILGLGIRNKAGFIGWYQDLLKKISWSRHIVTAVEVTGTEKAGFNINIIYLWRKRSKNNALTEVYYTEKWRVIVSPQGRLIIKTLKCEEYKD